MDHITEEDNTTSFSLPEIWQFPVANNANANIQMNVMSREHDPMLMDTSFKKRRDNLNSHATLIHNESDIKRMKTTGEAKQEGEANCRYGMEKTAKPGESSKQDYIHVKARRGQATDSHSLAERARREKISERMKILQDLVPGCNKVIGKALVLDEIINYIQSLQRQVEFLSLKLESINSRGPHGIDNFPSKEFAQQAFDSSSLEFSSQAARGYGGTSSEWLHMQLGGGFDRTS